MTYRIESTMPGIYRVLDGDRIVGMVMRCANKQWVMTDTDGATVGRSFGRFASAKAAAKAMEAMYWRDTSQPTKGEPQ